MKVSIHSRRTLCAAMLLVPLAAHAALSPEEIRAEAISISKVLRCPVSPNLTLYESEAAISSELKGKIYEMLRDGKSREDILNFMTERYGEQIRYEPDKNAGTAALWIAPWAALGAAAVFLGLRIRKSRNAKAR